MVSHGHHKNITKKSLEEPTVESTVEHTVEDPTVFEHNIEEPTVIDNLEEPTVIKDDVRRNDICSKGR